MRAKYLGLEVPAKIDITTGGKAIGVSNEQRLRGLALLFKMVRTGMLGETTEGECIVDASERTSIAGILVEGG